METLSLFDIHHVRWSHDRVYDHFTDGMSLFETVVQLLLGELKLHHLPPLQIVRRGKDLYSLSNRRLYMLRKYAAILKKFGHLHEKSTLSVPVSFCDLTTGEAFTTETGGLSVKLVRPLKAPTFLAHEKGPAAAPSARSLSRDARSHSRGRCLSSGKWVEDDADKGGCRAKRRASFGGTEYRFLLVECDDPPTSTVPWRRARTRSPTPARPSAQVLPDKEARAGKVLMAHEPQSLTTPESLRPVNNKVKSPRVRARSPSPARPFASAIQGKDAPGGKTLLACCKPSTTEAAKPQCAWQAWQNAEANSWPGLAPQKRSKTELAVADLLKKWIRLRKQIPKLRQTKPLPKVKALFDKLAPNGEEEEVDAWISGEGFSLGAESANQTFLEPLRQNIKRLETQVKDSWRSGTIPCGDSPNGERLAGMKSEDFDYQELLTTDSPDGSFKVCLAEVAGSPTVLFVDPIMGRVFDRIDALPAKAETFQSLEVFSETQLLLSGPQGDFSFDATSREFVPGRRERRS
mmetsp:Transcript_61733/g.137827  ORF Transcript_61733/g.137827 Transcript_61733/m.137827 type:complete len:518 (-) Transcript_61733:70-1623(-)